MGYSACTNTADCFRAGSCVLATSVGAAGWPDGATVCHCKGSIYAFSDDCSTPSA
jgi:hypothetical protein